MNTEANFEPLYVVPKDKKKTVRELKDALKGAEQLLLAMDEDREGESISWHLLQPLAPKVPAKRMVFHEITKEAIGKALDQTRTSTWSWSMPRKHGGSIAWSATPSTALEKGGLGPLGGSGSVGCCSIAGSARAGPARLRSGSYWDLKAQLDQAGHGFEAKLTHVSGKRAASGNDFDESTGGLKAGSDVRLLSEKEARALAEKVRRRPVRRCG